jgi:hypothetical protein
VRTKFVRDESYGAGYACDHCEPDCGFEKELRARPVVAAQATKECSGRTQEPGFLTRRGPGDCVLIFNFYAIVSPKIRSHRCPELATAGNIG